MVLTSLCPISEQADGQINNLKIYPRGAFAGSMGLDFKNTMREI